MGEIMIASVRQYAGRLIATGIAIVLAVAFLVAGLTVTSSYANTLQDVITAYMVNTDVKVSLKDDAGEDSGNFDALINSARDTVTQLPGVAAAGPVRFTAVDYREHGAREYFQVYEALPEPVEYRELVDGSWPKTATEAVVSSRRAKDLNLALGTELRLSSSAGSDPVTKTFTIVGIMQPATAGTGFLDADVLVTEEAIGSFDSFVGGAGVLVKAAPGTTPEALATAIRAALPADQYVVQTRDEVAATAIEDTTGSTLVLHAFIIGFGAIALLIAGFVIANTFRLLVTQRTKELALLRCVGTTTRQVRALVVGEAALVGLVFSCLGALVGVGLAYGLQAVLTSIEDSFAIAAISVSPIAVLVSITLGTLATMVFALGPARNAVKVHPLAALRPVEAAEAQRTSRKTVIVGGLITVTGTAIMLYFATTELFGMAVFGGMISAIGVMVLCKVVLPPLIGLVGQMIAPLGPTVALAGANATRNKQRTAATGTALLIGTALIAMLTTGTASVRESVLDTIDVRRPVDLLVQTTQEQGIAPGLVDRIASAPNVEATSVVTSGQITVTAAHGEALPVPVHGVDADTFQQTLHSPVTVPPAGPHEAVLNTENAGNLKDGDTVTLRGDKGEATFTVRTHEKANREGLDIAAASLDELVNSPQNELVLVKLPSGIGINEVEASTKAIQAIHDDLEVSGPAAERALYTSILNIILMVILGLLAISIIIAVVGVGNTAALSIWERRHESAMLRAIGVTRDQLVGLITTEAVLAAVVSVAVGIVLGVFYAKAGLTALASIADNVDFSLYIPWGQLALIVVGAFIAALAAAWLPAIGAARRPIVGELANT